MSSKINFLSGVASYNMMVLDTTTNKTFTVNIRPTSREIAALFVTELFSGQVQKDLDGIVTIFDYHSDCDIEVRGNDGYIFLDLSHSYTIAYRGEVLVIGFLLPNGHTSLLSSLFTFPPTEEEQRKIDMSYFTLLLNGTTKKGSNIIKVSSTDGLVEGRALYESMDDEDEEMERTIMAVDYANSVVTVDVEFTKTASNVTVYVR